MANTFLLDIEGTVCPISFVKDTLFPYFVSQLPQLIEQRGSNDSKIDDVLNSFEIADNTQLQQHILDLVARDVKDSKLKALQGFVWQQGYMDGSIKAPIYKDAIDLISNPQNNIYIYSSGSVKAQKLLFQYSCDIDDIEKKAINLIPFIKGYFDITTSGPKIESQSYTNILNDIKVKNEDVLFLSDNPLELDAAKKCNINVGLALRPGNNFVPNKQDYTNYTTFENL
ncbi:enolase-phosphatase E1 [Monosporozyma servazzii]